MKRLCLLLLLLLAGPAARAHVGSKDVFQTVNAGPYVLYVTVRPPNVIPGVATVEIRSSGAALNSLRITPLPVTGEAAKHPPASDAMARSAADPNFYTGSVWIMASGTWQVRVEADGAGGPQKATVPLVAVPITTLKMERSLGVTLALFGLVLLVAMAGIVGASIREARLRPGVAASPELRRRGWLAATVAMVLMIAALTLGNRWWNVQAADYAENIYSPSPTHASLSGNQLDLKVEEVYAGQARRHRGNGDFLPDHGHLMHLYAIRMPQMDAAFHLHPTLAAAGDFRSTLPVMPAGHYALYGDVVHKTGFPETLVSSLDVPAGMPGTALDGEDASAHPAALGAGQLGTAYKLPDGYTMTWDRPSPVTAGTAYTFHFHLLDPQGKPAAGMEPYLGMAGHAAFVKADGTTFAHTHPEGSAAMADVMLADESMGGMSAMAAPVTPDVGFPYGFPSAGRFRIFVQMKHAGVVETGVFDAEVK